MLRRSLPLLAALVAVSACATASAPPPPAVTALPPADLAEASPPPTSLKGYLTPQDLDGVQILGPPPAADSPRGAADRATYDETRPLAGTARWNQAKVDNDIWFGGAVRRFACILGKDISARSTPYTYRLLQRLELDARTVGEAPKHQYMRTRPLIGNDKPVCVPRADWLRTNGSYPSGHSMTGWSWGLVMAELAPAKASPLLDAGREIGQSRVICGVHFQSDVDAGRTLASAMVARLHADPAFQRDVAVAKAELARATAPASGCGG